MGEEVPLYDRLGDSYDVMVNWEERLQMEEPFFQRLLLQAGARRVLDVGCATGGHVLRFAGMGLETVGADPSAEMVRLARERATNQRGVTFVEAGFGQIRERVAGSFDVVTCLGNTLPHATSGESLREAVQDMGSLLRPGGLLAIQQLNYDRILAERRRFLGVSSGRREGVEHLFFRFYDFHEPLLTFNVVTFREGETGWGYEVGSTTLRAIRRDELAEALAGAGFRQIEWYGSLSADPFEQASSNDLVAVAALAATG